MAGSTRTSGSGADRTDAWLNEVRAQAWDQGRLAAKWDTPNPYRTAEQVREAMDKEGE